MPILGPGATGSDGVATKTTMRLDGDTLERAGGDQSWYIKWATPKLRYILTDGDVYRSQVAGTNAVFSPAPGIRESRDGNDYQDADNKDDDQQLDDCLTTFTFAILVNHWQTSHAPIIPKSTIGNQPAYP